MATQTTVAIADAGTRLFVKGVNSTYETFVSVTAAPATGSTPSLLDVTTLDSITKQFIFDREEIPAYEFEYNYTKENYTKVAVKLDGKTQCDFLLVYSDGSGEKFSGCGRTWKDAVSIGTSVKAKMSISVSSHEHAANVTVSGGTATVGM